MIFNKQPRTKKWIGIGMMTASALTMVACGGDGGTSTQTGNVCTSLPPLAMKASYKVGFVQVGDFGVRRRFRPRLLFRVPRRDPRTARKQRISRGQPGARQTVDRIMFAGEGLGRDHLSLRVARPARASTKLTIQKRMTTVGSDQPRCSKW